MAALGAALIRMTPWKASIQKSLKKNKELAYSRYVQLATVKPDGKPSNRTVVFRGFLEEGEDLTFVTDQRSCKVGQVALNPAAEVCWYFPKTREQYRLAGTLTIVGADSSDERLQEARQLAWSRMSDGGRAQFTWPHPGVSREGADDAFSQQPPSTEEPALPTFCLVMLQVSEVDHLTLTSNTRRTYQRKQLEDGSNEWIEADVNP